jgi:hypothetical protein
MGKIKEMVIDINEEYESGISIYNIAQIHNLPVCEVIKMIELMNGPLFDSPEQAEQGDKENGTI